MKVVRVVYHQEDEGWWAESPDVEGWSAAGRSLPEIEELVGAGLEFALGRPVSWTRLETGDGV
jgi:predicted RNase H-like HicB family nuclease